MDRTEAAKVLAVIRGAYPNGFNGKSRSDLQDIVNVWADMFADDPVAKVGAAVKAFIASDTGGFPPAIGQVKEIMFRMERQGGLTEVGAWNMIRKAIGNSAYGSQEEFEALPPVLQKLVGSPSQLRDWAMVDTDELNTVVASNVQRAYRVVQAREKEDYALPQSVRAAITGIERKMLSE